MRRKCAAIFFAAASVLVVGCSFAKAPPDPAKSAGAADGKEVSAPAVTEVPVISISDDRPAYPVAQEDEPDEPEYPPGYYDEIVIDASWEYADHAQIDDDTARLYRASSDRKDIIISVNAGHGTKGGQSVKTYCHPDKSPKTTGGSTPAGSVKAPAVTGGMTFNDGTREATVTLACAEYLKDALLEEGYDVLMLRYDDDAQLDNVARTVMSNNIADCMISLHWDGDGLTYDKGCFYISVPEKLKSMQPVASYWQEHDALGEALIDALRDNGYKISGAGHMSIDLTQMSYSTIPSVDIELGNGASAHDDTTLQGLAQAIAEGTDEYERNRK